jgi:hypothetical protein
MVERFERLTLNYYSAAGMIVNQIGIAINPRVVLFIFLFLDIVGQQKD